MWGRVGLILASVVAGLFALELGLRALHPGYLGKWTNLVRDARTVLAAQEQSRFAHDPQFGHLPRGGLRGNGGTAPPAARPILAVGDSYTWGEEVADGETWPAHLERLLRRPVLNGGVSGYGFDQTVLRAEALARERKPAAVIVSFIADDIRRTEMRRLWGVDKPYFAIEGGGLALKGVPVPPRADPGTTLGFWQRTLGYSFLVDFVLRRLDLLHDWFGDHIRVHREGEGKRIACLLTARLAALQQEIGAPVLVLAQYDPVIWREQQPSLSEQRRLTSDLLKCAAAHDLAVIDSFDSLTQRPRELKGYYVLWHMSNAGNQLTAGLVTSALRRVRLD
ncbi:MAG TPA: GDSL-type esterase/lipase family protein [Reyranellaceae bacterium]|nr:GDSL-type esterase/lipase family protein [Reyranellaceae bacterium]